MRAPTTQSWGASSQFGRPSNVKRQSVKLEGIDAEIKQLQGVYHERLSLFNTRNDWSSHSFFRLDNPASQFEIRGNNFKWLITFGKDSTVRAENESRGIFVEEESIEKAETVLNGILKHLREHYSTVASAKQSAKVKDLISWLDLLPPKVNFGG